MELSRTAHKRRPNSKRSLKTIQREQREFREELKSEKEQTLIKNYIEGLEKKAKVKILVPRPAPQMMMPGM